MIALMHLASAVRLNLPHRPAALPHLVPALLVPETPRVFRILDFLELVEDEPIRDAPVSNEAA